MSLSPQPDPINALREAVDAAGPQRTTSAARAAAALTAAVAFGAGLFLAVAPWTDGWSFNSLQEMSPTLEYLWHEPSFRGAVSGLGIANLLIAFQEALRALRKPVR